MIICLDTNVFVSGLFWKGKPAEIIELWTTGFFEIVVSPEILTEYEEVLRRFESRIPSDKLELWIEFSKSRSRLINPIKQTKTFCRDTDDEKFLVCALQGRADYLVTGDKDLLVIKNTFPFQICKPGDFLKKISSSHRL